ncbi:MAG TPA: LPS export ABC transporter ATP-binding protein, partial [Acidiphilium sp.]|nr:LPS export ABC transporter ATP-binding protein [Acidiphilium sp.]
MKDQLRVIPGGIAAQQGSTPAAATEHGLVARGLGKSFRKRPVVRNVSVTLRRGEAVGLLGPNGA